MDGMYQKIWNKLDDYEDPILFLNYQIINQSVYRKRRCFKI